MSGAQGGRGPGDERGPSVIVDFDAVEPPHEGAPPSTRSAAPSGSGAPIPPTALVDEGWSLASTHPSLDDLVEEPDDLQPLGGIPELSADLLSNEEADTPAIVPTSVAERAAQTTAQLARPELVSTVRMPVPDLTVTARRPLAEVQTRVSPIAQSPTVVTRAPEPVPTVVAAANTLPQGIARRTPIAVAPVPSAARRTPVAVVAVPQAARRTPIAVAGVPPAARPAPAPAPAPVPAAVATSAPPSTSPATRAKVATVPPPALDPLPPPSPIVPIAPAPAAAPVVKAAPAPVVKEAAAPVVKAAAAPVVKPVAHLASGPVIEDAPPLSARREPAPRRPAATVEAPAQGVPLFDDDEPAAPVSAPPRAAVSDAARDKEALLGALAASEAPPDDELDEVHARPGEVPALHSHWGLYVMWTLLVLGLIGGLAYLVWAAFFYQPV